MPGDTQLVAVQEESITFYSDAIPLLRTAANQSVDTFMVPLRPLCEIMGIAWTGQHDRILRDDILSSLLQSVQISRNTPGGSTLLCLPLRYLPGWLFGITASRITNPDVRAKVLRFQREAYDVLWEHYQHTITHPTPIGTGAQAAYDEARAIAHLARQQLALETAAGQVSTQLHTLELSLTEIIDTNTTVQLSNTIKEVANILRRQGNQQAYQHVYAAIIERYAISSFHQLTPEQSQDAIRWLQEWKERSTP